MVQPPKREQQAPSACCCRPPLSSPISNLRLPAARTTPLTKTGRWCLPSLVPRLSVPQSSPSTAFIISIVVWRRLSLSAPLLNMHHTYPTPPLSPVVVVLLDHDHQYSCSKPSPPCLSSVSRPAVVVVLRVMVLAKLVAQLVVTKHTADSTTNKKESAPATVSPACLPAWIGGGAHECDEVLQLEHGGRPHHPLATLQVLTPHHTDRQCVSNTGSRRQGVSG